MKKITLLVAAISCILSMSAAVQGTAPANVELVDLGLSVNWATINIGATTPTEPGTYFAWGETEKKDYYDWNTYKYGKDAMALTKYCSDASCGLAGFTDTLSVLEAIDDAATQNWGEDYRMPTMYEWMELIHHCKWTWVNNYENSNVAGYKVTSKVNNNFIFLPTTGYQIANQPDCVNSDGYYWTSTLDVNTPNFGWLINFFKEGATFGCRRDNLYRSCGRAVRAVSTTKNATNENGLELQELVDNTPAGGTLTLNKDYILGSQTMNGIFITKAIKLDLNGHTISGQQLVRCLFIATENQNDEVIIEDNSSAQTGAITEGFSEFGGAIYANNGHIIMNSGKITKSATDGYHWGGGAIYLDIDASLTINGGEITNNNTELGSGAAIYAAGNFVMKGGVISNNYTQGNGGAICVDGVTTIESGTITKNTALFGGGIFVYDGEGIILNLTSAANDSIVITGNTALGAEGGVTGNGIINLSGKIICKDNICNNPGFEYLKNFWPYDIVHVTGDLKGSKIYFGAANGETDAPQKRVFATDYAKFNLGIDFKNYFTFEGPSRMSAVVNNAGAIEIVTATGLENTNGNNITIRKTIENGMLVIEANGVRYNALGEIID